MLFKDIVYSWRVLRKSPGFAMIAIAALALGIGANTAIFSVVNATLLRPLPFREPEKLVVVSENNVTRGIEKAVTSVATFLDWRSQNSVFEAMGATAGGNCNLTGTDAPRRLECLWVSASMFDVLGVHPLLGRPFSKEEDDLKRSDVVILSHSFWKRRFGGDPSVIDKKISLDERTFTIVGVMPPSFRLFGMPVQGWPQQIVDTDIYRPLGIWPGQLKMRNARELLVIARLKNGTSIEGARAEFKTIAARLGQQFPDSYKEWGVTITNLHDEVTSHGKLALWVVLGAVGFVLVIAVANIANLLLARAAARQKEFAVRIALGANGWQIARQLLTESLMLALAGGVAGLWVAFAGIQILKSILPEGFSRGEPLTLDGMVLLSALAISVLAGLLFGLAPALQIFRTNLAVTLNEGTRGSSESFTRNPFRSLLVVAEVSLALVLLAGTGLMLRSFSDLRKVETGFKPAGLIAMDVAMTGRKYTNSIQYSHTIEQSIQQLQSLPGVDSVAAVYGLPFGAMLGVSTDVAAPSAELFGSEEVKVNAGYRLASPNYFKTMGIPIVRGRDFTANDRTETNSQRVAIINQSLARSLKFENPVGRQLVLYADGTDPVEIVGVVADVKASGLKAPAQPEVYRPILQRPLDSFSLVIRSSQSSGPLTAAVQAQIAKVESDLPVYNVRELEQAIMASIGSERLVMFLLALFGALALALASIGIYGVISYSVSQRTREFGVRLALGAQKRDISRLVLKQGLVLSLIGVALGLLMAFFLTRVLMALLHGISAHDPATFGAVSCLLIFVALVGCYFPARKAASADPVVALRQD